MDTRNLLHLGLVLPAIGGLLMAGLLFSKSIEYPGSDTPFPEVATSAWSKVVAAIPADMPTVYGDSIEGEEDLETFAETNAFIVTCAVLMLFGFLGVGLVSGAKTLDEPVWNPLLRIGTILALTLVSVTFYGFNVAYPGDFNGVISLGFFAAPESIDPVEYEMSGMTVWADAFYFACFVAVLGVLAMTTTSGRQNATSAFLIAFPIIFWIGPVVTAWKWGGGWLDLLGVYDFAGAGLFHWHAGAVVLGVGVIMKAFRRSWATRQPIPDRPQLPRLGLWIPGILLYSLLLLGMNVGSTLTAQPDLVAAVLQTTVYAALAGKIFGGITGFFLPTRSPIEWAGMGWIAGSVVVSGATDLMTSTMAITLGCAVGILMPLVVYVCDRWLAIDPLGVFGVHGVPGLIGMLAVISTRTDLGDGEGSFPTAGAAPQILSLLAIPLMSLALACVVALVFGLLRFLFFDRRIESNHDRRDVTPPPLPTSH